MNALQSRQTVQVRGARCHNLKAVDVDVPLRQFVVVTGVSGSGKSSLSVHTIGAAGQRQFLETMSPRLRRQWDRLDPPEVDHVAHVPPVVMLQGDTPSLHSDPRSTVATLLGVEADLADWFATQGMAYCPQCQIPVTAATPASVFDDLLRDAPQRRAMIAFAIKPAEQSPAEWTQAGYARAIVNDDIVSLAELKRWPPRAKAAIVVDRLKVEPASAERWRESLAIAFREGGGLIEVLLETTTDDQPQTGGSSLMLDGRVFHRREFSAMLLCRQCGRTLRPLTPALFDRRVQDSACAVCARLPAGSDCPACDGLQLCDEALASRVDDRSWRQCHSTAVSQLTLFNVPAPVSSRLRSLTAIGLGHLSLGRATATLSTGDVCRILLAQAAVLPTTDTLFVVEEPGAGWHPADVPQLVDVLRSLLARRNSVLVVDHHPDVIHAADWVIELGPAAGNSGGQVIAADAPANLEALATTVTGQAWASITSAFSPRKRRIPSGWSMLQNVRVGTHTLAELRWPLGALGVITGRSGSGKSALLEGLYRAWTVAIGKPDPSSRSPTWDACDLPPGFTDVVLVDSTPLNRNKRSTVVTWLKIYDELREVFANTAEAKRRGWTAADFSFLSPQGGRCPICQGLGRRFVETGLQHQETVTCPECRGTRFRPEFLEARYRGLSIHDVLMRTTAEAATLFRHLPKVFSRLHALSELGLGYLVLGQPVLSLSGGEVQRLKLASRLWGRAAGPALLLCDTPSMGLHTLDIAALVRGLQQLVDLGHTVIVADHHRGILDAADWILELDTENSVPF
ncbi:MAG TPA: hypothetical protein VFG20_08765 [Planctomycetaceae bacterium]|nr:hypothetical protein [Planctomycetaceae bacterium]